MVAGAGVITVIDTGIECQQQEVCTLLYLPCRLLTSLNVRKMFNFFFLFYLSVFPLVY